jgi:pyruvate/2-oxoglutarate dehydrogenase complex dihydrolipoamide dehydrogenase (E3) component
MPSKALFEPIDAMHHARQHGWLKVEPLSPNEYLAEIVRWKDREIGAFQDYRETEIRDLASDDFRVIRANACFTSAHEVESRGQRYTFDAAVIASGSVTTVPQIEGLDLVRDVLWTSDEILHNTRIPQSLAVIGAGAIGIEFSLRYTRLGCRVTLLSKSPLLPRYSQQFGKRLAMIYQSEGVRVLTASKVVRRISTAEGWIG